MCDYDYDGSYTELSTRRVRIRKPRRCDSCGTTFSAGAAMERQVSIQDGEFTQLYECAACQWSRLDADDEGPLHMCWGWNEEGGYLHGQETWDYIHYCLENNETPTVAGLDAVLAQHAAAEDV